MSPHKIPNIPIFELSTKVLNAGSSSWVATSKNVRLALEEYGFFIVEYNNVSPELDHNVFDALQELFDLPIETKKKNTSDLIFYGYVGQLPHAPLHESMGIPAATTIDDVRSFANLMWPLGNERFCEIILSYCKLVSQLEQTVDRMVFESYGAQKHYESHVRSTTYLLRPIKYSAPDNNNDNNNNVGTRVHTDKGFLTIIHQNQINGLEVQLRNGEWLAVDVPPGSFVVMAGDAYHAWSNGRIFAPKHQVIIKADKPRYSLPLVSFNHGITVIPEEVVDSDHPLRFKPFDNFGLARFFLCSTTPKAEGTAEAYCGVSV